MSLETLFESVGAWHIGLSVVFLWCVKLSSRLSTIIVFLAIFGAL